MAWISAFGTLTIVTEKDDCIHLYFQQLYHLSEGESQYAYKFLYKRGVIIQNDYSLHQTIKINITQNKIRGLD